MPVRVEGPISQPAPSGFRRRVEELSLAHQRRWARALDGIPTIGGPSGLWRRWSNARATGRLIDEIGRRVESVPDAEDEIASWQEDLRGLLLGFGERRFGWPAAYRRLVLGEGFHSSTIDFVRQARRFEPDIDMAEVGQALRNVWIVNSLQMLFGVEGGMSPAVFAYSMLYPYTDNLLDDPDLPAEAKRAFNRRLGARLAGEPVLPASPHERRVFELIELIEGHFPRAEFDEVHQSLLAIHRGQVQSVRLQAQSQTPSEERILATQVEKGGASVLADGYLMHGSLTSERQDFCFGYGVFLQLLDDLQDAEADREAGHATLFSCRAGREPLDSLTCRLHSYMVEVVESSPCLAGPAHAGPRDLILRNCTTLMMGAIAESPRYFSRGFRRRLTRRWPLGFRAMRRLRKRAQRVFGQARRTLEERRGVESLWDLVG